MRSAVWPGLPSSSQLLVSYKPAAAAAAALFKPSPVHSWGCSVSNLCGTQLPVNPGRLAVVTISRSASKRGPERMSSGQGCIRTCTHPAEVYQVQQLLASLPVSRVRSRDQPHSVTRGGSWIYLMLFFVFFFSYQFVSRFLWWNWSTSICQFSSYFDLSSARRFLSEGRPESVMSSRRHRQRDLARWAVSSLSCGREYQRTGCNGCSVSLEFDLRLWFCCYKQANANASGDGGSIRIFNCDFNL